MSDDIIDLIDDDTILLPALTTDTILLPALTTEPPAPLTAQPDVAHTPTSPAKKELPLAPADVTPLTADVTPLKIPSLFADDDDENNHTPASQPTTVDNLDTSRRLSRDIFDDSDEELRELFAETTSRPRNPSNASPNTRSTTFPIHSATAGASSSVATASKPASANLSRPANAASSAAEYFGDEDRAPTEVDPALLEDDRDFYCNSSLYQGDEKPEKQELDTQQMHQLLELNKKSSDASQEMETPLEMKSLLMKHQKQALYWMVNRESEDNPPGHPRGGILADDQGFGKTVSMIALLLTNRPEAKEGETTRWGNLIVAPTSVLNQWASEIKEHIAEQFWPRVLLYHGPNKPKQAKSLTLYDVVVTTYGTLYQEYPRVLEKDRGLVLKRKKPGNLFKIDWFRVVLDEAQAIRNFRRETFKAASSLTARRKWSLTGTPIQNTVNDIYSQFMFLGYHVTADYKEWETRFKKPLEGKYCTKAHFERFQAILGVVLLRRAKHDKIDNKPVIELPPRETTTLELSFSKTEKQFYESQEERAVNRIHREAGTSGNDFALALNVILRLRQACGHPALCYWGTGFQFNFSDDELDVVELRMNTKCMFNMLPEPVKNRLFIELGPTEPVAQTCPVCLDVIESGIVTKCGHLFCISDYESWRRENDSCPSCRATLGEEDDVMSLDGVRKEIHAIARKKRREEEARLAKTELLMDASPSKAEPLILGSHPGKAEPIILDSSAKAEPQEFNAFGKRSAGPSSLEPSTKSQRLSDDASETSDASEETDDSDAGQSGGNSDERATELKTSTKIKRFMMEFEKIFEDTEDKVLCFSQWTRMLDLVEESVKEQGYEYVRLDGTLSTTKRDEQVRLFKSRSKCRLFLISLTAGSTGLNLTVANRVFLLDSWWNPAVENQAIDRVHRIGQKKPVQVIKLKIENTIEERILAIQEKKRQIIDGALGVEGLKTMGRRRLTMRDLMSLFQDVAGNVANRAQTTQNDAMATRANEVLDMTRDMASSSGGDGDLSSMLRYN